MFSCVLRALLVCTGSDEERWGERRRGGERGGGGGTDSAIGERHTDTQVDQQ